jgi:hypothetical protein
VFNLLRWRLCYLDAAVPTTILRPSGVVPGPEFGRCDPSQSSAGGDKEEEGPDGVFANLCRVLFARFQDQAVLSFLFKVLYVKCKATTYE